MKNKKSQNDKRTDNKKQHKDLCVVCGKPVVNIRGKTIPGLTRCFLHSDKRN